MALLGAAPRLTVHLLDDPQLGVQRAACCGRVFRDVASGAARQRLELRRGLKALVHDLLAVARPDRLARSRCHLLEIARDGAP